MNKENIFLPTVDNLSTIVEEGSRANKKNTKRFVEPAQGTLRRAQICRHHIIFGRRGSGKSSLLYKTYENLAEKGHPIAFVDLEPFKGHEYPDILISALIAVFTKYKYWLKNYIERDEPKKLWFKFWIKKSDSLTNNKKLLGSIEDAILLLVEQLNLVDNATLIKKSNEVFENDNKQQITGGFNTNFENLASSNIESVIAKSEKSSKGKELHEEYKRSKSIYLLKEIINYQQIFHDLNSVTSKDCFIILDDLYHILRKDQAQLLDYFHRIFKGNHVWLMVGTIKNRTTWYLNDPQPVGLKTGDDADEINLDLTLEKFTISKDFLKSILKIYINEAQSPNIDDLITEGGVDRLVIASGGVARDFLGLFRRSIDETRERIRKDPKHPRGPKIGAEDVNIAAGAYGELKKEEFHRDTIEERNELENAFNKIKSFCLEKTKKNVFLVDQDLLGKNYEYLLELMDLRLIHQVKSRITVSSRPGKVYRAHLLDVSQYTGERTRRDVDMIDFWKEEAKESLRRVMLIYDPDVDFEILKSDIEKQKKSHSNKPDESNNTIIDNSTQITLDFK